MKRRTLMGLAIALPALGLGSAAARASSTGKSNVWTAGEIRLAGTMAQARALQARTGVPTRAVFLRGGRLVDALSAGHLEAAVLDLAELRLAIGRMGRRIEPMDFLGRRALVTRRVLPSGLKGDIVAALRQRGLHGERSAFG